VALDTNHQQHKFMEKAVEQIFLAFNHIARELQVYFISGVLLMLNIFAIDYFYYDSSFWGAISQNSLLDRSL